MGCSLVPAAIWLVARLARLHLSQPAVRHGPASSDAVTVNSPVMPAPCSFRIPNHATASLYSSAAKSEVPHLSCGDAASHGAEIAGRYDTDLLAAPQLQIGDCDTYDKCSAVLSMVIIMGTRPVGTCSHDPTRGLQSFRQQTLHSSCSTARGEPRASR